MAVKNLLVLGIMIFLAAYLAGCESHPVVTGNTASVTIHTAQTSNPT
jgi:hypothetical protein